MAKATAQLQIRQLPHLSPQIAKSLEFLSFRSTLQMEYDAWHNRLVEDKKMFSGTSMYKGYFELLEHQLLFRENTVLFLNDIAPKIWAEKPSIKRIEVETAYKEEFKWADLLGDKASRLFCKIIDNLDLEILNIAETIMEKRGNLGKLEMIYIELKGLWSIVPVGRKMNEAKYPEMGFDNGGYRAGPVGSCDSTEMSGIGEYAVSAFDQQHR
jgi:hypothetical protein